MWRIISEGLPVGLIVLIAGSVAVGADWPNWLGPNHDGISPEKGFKTDWTRPPEVVWEYPVGSAFSSFTCVGGKAYTCGTQNKQQVLFCFEADTGKVLWSKPFEEELKESQGGDGTRATPTVDQGRVYILGAHGSLVCFEAKNGGEVWKKKFNNKPQWAYAGSVLIEGDLAIVAAGGSDGALLALNKKTGDVVWKCADDPAAYATPYPFTFESERYVVGFMAKAAIVATVKTGKEVLRIPWETSYDINASSPIYHAGHLFLSSGYSTGCALFKLKSQGDKLVADEIWRSKVLLTKFRSCILTEGILYSGDQRGLHCVEFMTGKERWSVPRMPHASVLLADGYLLILSGEGKLISAKASPDGFKPIAEAEVLSGRCWTVPTLYNKRLYLRNLKKAVCLDLSP